MSNTVVRYSDDELAEFKALIDKKLENAREQLSSLQEQILEITENTSDEHGGDWMDDSSINNDVEMLNNMAIRQRRYIKDLENALVRIRNKTYGICSVTGDLIDKKRLLAVPTTTKSLMAKNQEQNPPAPERKPAPPERPAPSPTPGKKVITRVIRKSPTKPAPPKSASFDDEDDDFNLDDFYDDETEGLDKAMVSLDDLNEEDDTVADDQDDDLLIGNSDDDMDEDEDMDM